MRRNRSRHGMNVTGKGHSPTGDRIIRDKSGHGRSAFEKVSLTSWRPHREGQIRTQKGWDQAKGTHELRPYRKGQFRIRTECDREWHSRTEDRIGRNKSGHGKNATE